MASNTRPERPPRPYLLANEKQAQLDQPDVVLRLVFAAELDCAERRIPKDYYQSPTGRRMNKPSRYRLVEALFGGWWSDAKSSLVSKMLWDRSLEDLLQLADRADELDMIENAEGFFEIRRRHCSGWREARAASPVSSTLWPRQKALITGKPPSSELVTRGADDLRTAADAFIADLSGHGVKHISDGTWSDDDLATGTRVSAFRRCQGAHRLRAARRWPTMTCSTAKPCPSRLTAPSHTEAR